MAIKIFDGDAQTDERTLHRVLREGRAAAAIRHPHVMGVLDVGVEDGRAYLVLELLDGEDLGQHLLREAPLSATAASDLLVQLAAGVTAIHEVGILHCDLKPSNVLLARRRGGVEPVVVDFGISRPSLSSVVREGHSLAFAGTPSYMAPEQLRGSDALTPSCDQYALGVILYECVTSGKPFWADDYYGLLHQIMTAPIVRPSELNPRIPPELDAIVLRALSRDPAARFPSVSAFGEALLPFASASVADRRERVARDGAGDEPSGGTTVSHRAPSARERSGAPRRGALPLVLATPVLLAGAFASAVYVGASVASSAGATPGEESAAIPPRPGSGREPLPSVTTDREPPVERHEAATASLRAAVSPVSPNEVAAAPPAPAAKAPPSSSPAPPARGAEATNAETAVERGTGGIPIVE